MNNLSTYRFVKVILQSSDKWPEIKNINQFQKKEQKKVTMNEYVMSHIKRKGIQVLDARG
jgi:hypothetical protein